MSIDGVIGWTPLDHHEEAMKRQLPRTDLVKFVGEVLSAKIVEDVLSGNNDKTAPQVPRLDHFVLENRVRELLRKMAE